MKIDLSAGPFGGLNVEWEEGVKEMILTDENGKKYRYVLFVNLDPDIVINQAVYSGEVE